MRAVWVQEHGGLEALDLVDRPDPVAGAGEVVVAMRATALNHLDHWVRVGVPGHRFPLPLIPGSDGMGEVVSVGEGVDAAWLGRRVALHPGVSCGRCRSCLSGAHALCRSYGIRGESMDGVHAEQVACPVADLLPVPDAMTDAEAAAAPLAFLTAWHMLVSRAQVRPGEHVLVHAAGSGVGSAAIQIARLWGCTVWTTASTEAKRTRALDLGAHHALPYEGVHRAVRGPTDGGVDVVVEHTGEATWGSSIKALRWGGRLVTCGATTGAEVPLDLRVLFFKQLSLLGSTMGGRGEMLDVWAHVCGGTLRPVVDEVFPREAIREAYASLSDRSRFGKRVLCWV